MLYGALKRIFRVIGLGSKRKGTEIIDADEYVKIIREKDKVTVEYGDGTKEGDRLDRCFYRIGCGEGNQEVYLPEHIFCAYYPYGKLTANPERILVGNNALVMLNYILKNKMVGTLEHAAYLVRRLFEEESKIRKPNKFSKKSRMPHEFLHLKNKIKDLTDVNESGLDWAHIQKTNNKVHAAYFRVTHEQEGRKVSGENKIVCKQFDENSRLGLTLKGKEAIKIIYVIGHRELAPNKMYFGYLAKELLKAEKEGENYAQDLKEESRVEAYGIP